MIPRSLQHVRINQHGQHTKSLVVLNEAHAAHIGGEIVNFACALTHGIAVILQVQVQDEVFSLVTNLVPLLQRLDIHCSNPADASLAQIRNERAANESTRSSYNRNAAFHKFTCPRKEVGL